MSESSMSEKIHQLHTEIEVHGQKAMELLEQAKEIYQKTHLLNPILPGDVVKKLRALQKQAMKELRQSETLRKEFVELEREELRKAWDFIKDL
jgi:hypothetical protein